MFPHTEFSVYLMEFWILDSSHNKPAEMLLMLLSFIWYVAIANSIDSFARKEANNKKKLSYVV